MLKLEVWKCARQKQRILMKCLVGNTFGEILFSPEWKMMHTC